MTLSLLKEHFGCCLKMLRMLSDNDKKEAIEHIRTVLSHFEVENFQPIKSEYVEYLVKEEEDIKPDITELANPSNNTAVRVEESLKRKHDEASDTAVVVKKNTNMALASFKLDGLYKLSMKQQVETLAMEQGMEMIYMFLKPAGHEYRIGERAEIGDYEVCVILTQDDVSVIQFSGEGSSSPYEAIRNACKKAKIYLIDKWQD